METQYEQFLAVRNDKHELVGFYCHDITKREVIFYTCEKASLDEIKNLMEQMKICEK